MTDLHQPSAWHEKYAGRTKARPPTGQVLEPRLEGRHGEPCLDNVQARDPQQGVECHHSREPLRGLYVTTKYPGNLCVRQANH